MGKIFSPHVHACKICYFFIILIKFILSLHLVEYGKQNLRLFQVSPCVSLGGHESQDFYRIWNHGLEAAGPQYHRVSMLASTSMSAIPSGLQSSVDAHDYCILLVPAPKLLQVPAISLLLFPPLGGWETSYCSQLYWGLKIVTGPFVQTRPAT